MEEVVTLKAVAAPARRRRFRLRLPRTGFIQVSLIGVRRFCSRDVRPEMKEIL
jgi:hypothetical protein